MCRGKQAVVEAEVVCRFSPDTFFDQKFRVWKTWVLPQFSDLFSKMQPMIDNYGIPKWEVTC